MLVQDAIQAYKKMAIDTIKNQPTAYDIDKVVTELNELEVKVITRYKNGDFGDFDGVDYYIKKSKAIEIVKQEAEKFGTDINVWSNGWIPCSERLPLEKQDVLVCFERIDGLTIAWYDTYLRIWRNSSTDYTCKAEPIAWKPLPEPFKESD